MSHLCDTCIHAADKHGNPVCVVTSWARERQEDLDDLAESVSAPFFAGAIEVNVSECEGHTKAEQAKPKERRGKLHVLHTPERG